MLQLLSQVVYLVYLVVLVGFVLVYYYYPNNYLAFQEPYRLRLREGFLSNPFLFLAVPRVVAYFVVVEAFNLRYVLRGLASFFLKDTYIHGSRVVTKGCTRG